MLPAFLSGPCFGDTTPSEAPSSPTAPSTKAEAPNAPFGLDEPSPMLDVLDVDYKTEQNRRIQPTIEPPAEASLIDVDDEEHVSTGIGIQPTCTIGLHADLLGIEFEAPSGEQPLTTEESGDLVQFNTYGSRGATPTPEEVFDYGEADENHMCDGSRPHEYSIVAPEMPHEEPQGENDIYGDGVGEHDAASLSPGSSSPVRFLSSPGASSQTSLNDYDLGCDKSDHPNLEDRLTAQHGAMEHSGDHAPSSSPPPFSSSPRASSELWGDDYETDYEEIQCPEDEEQLAQALFTQVHGYAGNTETAVEGRWQIYDASLEWVDEHSASKSAGFLPYPAASPPTDLGGRETGSDRPSELHLEEGQRATRDVEFQEPGEEESDPIQEGPFKVEQDTAFALYSAVPSETPSTAQQQELSLKLSTDAGQVGSPGRDSGYQGDRNPSPCSMYFNSRESSLTPQEHASNGDPSHETWEPFSPVPCAANPNKASEDVTKMEGGFIDPAQGLQEIFNGNENEDPIDPAFGPAGRDEFTGAGLDLDTASMESQIRRSAVTRDVFPIAMKAILKAEVEPRIPHDCQDDNDSSLSTYQRKGTQGLMQYVGAGLTPPEQDTDERAGVVQVGDQDETSSKTAVKLPQDADVERNPASSSHRSPVLSAPNPKRPTIAGQLAQQKKLSKPFRCPTILKPKIDGTSIKGKTWQHPADPERTQPQFGQQRIEAIPQLEGDNKIKHRTVRAAAQFKSPLTVLPSEQQRALVRLTPTVQALERRAQTLKRALRVVRDNEEATLQELIQKWTEAGREIAFELWTLVKDSTVEGSGDRWDGGSTLKRKVAESWGWDDGADRKRTPSGNGSSWGWDLSAEDNHGGEDEGSASRVIAGAEEGQGELEKTHETIGTMLMQLGICPTTLGWVEEEECFVD